MYKPRVVLAGSRVALRCYSTQTTKPPTYGNAASKSAGAPPTAAGIKSDVPGLSKKCVLPRAQPLGPGASTTGDYKVPEYYCYDKTSYAEAEIEMANFRCPQPSANRKN